MKIRLTESQYSRLNKRLNEGVGGDLYQRSVKLNLYLNGSKIKGLEIDSITEPEVDVKYGIDIEARSWGIKNISIGEIYGPSEVEVEVDYYIDDFRTNTEVITLKLDWENAKRDKNTSSGVVCVGDDIWVDLGNDAEGNLIVTNMEIPINVL